MSSTPSYAPHFYRLALASIIIVGGWAFAELPARAAGALTPAVTSAAGGYVESLRRAISGQLSPFASHAQTPAPDPQTVNDLIGKAREGGTVKVIVGFRLGKQKLDAESSGPERDAQRAEIKRKQTLLLTRLKDLKVANVKQFDYLPFIAMEVSADVLASLRESPDVVSIQEDAEQHSSLLQSIPLIGGNNAGTFGGFTGQGRTVAILDTGVDKAHPFLSGSVVSEACYSTNSQTTTSLCPGGASQSTATDSALPCNVNELSGCFHGTHLAGIAAGGNPQISGNGVARDANVIAIQVYSRSTDCGQNPSPCLTALASDTILGLERVYALRTTFSIDAVNVSLSGGRYFSHCDAEQPAYKAIIDNLRAAGIATVVASGNDGYTDSLSAPACVSSAISVGSTSDGSVKPVDTVSSFSNSASFLSLLAPGELITSSQPGGSFFNAQGTSQAAAHVTGAWAVIRQKFPNDPVEQVATRLRNGGVQVLDQRNSVTKPRIKVDAALNASSVATTPAGGNVAVQTPSGDARVTFNSVTQAGGTTFTPIDPSTAGAPPAGFTVLPNAPAYDITTTAAYTPPVTVCFTLNSVTSEAEFARVRILHGENGQLVDRTVLAPDTPAPDFGTRRVCARVNSLSPFVTAQVAAEPTPTPTPTPTATPTPTPAATPTPAPPVVQFGQAVFSVTEGCVPATLTITLTGAPTAPVAVDYLINEGTAKQKTDFTYAAGTVLPQSSASAQAVRTNAPPSPISGSLIFAVGETAKEITVLITEDGFAEGTEDLSATLTNPRGAALGGVTSATLNINDNETVDSQTNPVDEPATFVCQLYHDFLHRQPDPAGLAFWTEGITRCGADPACVSDKRHDVAAAFFLSIEFQQTGFLVYRAYEAGLDRRPRYEEFMTDLNAVGLGVEVGVGDWQQRLDSQRGAFAESFIGRAEFRALFPDQMTAEQFADRLFQHAGTSPAGSERQAVIDAYGVGNAQGRAAALAAALETGSIYNRLYNPGFVLVEYFGFLRRDPDDPPDTDLSGYNFWLGKMDSFTLAGEDARLERDAFERIKRAEMIRAFIVSGEYRKRFGQ